MRSVCILIACNTLDYLQLTILLIYNGHHILGLPVNLQEDSSALEGTIRPVVPLLQVLPGLLWPPIVHNLLGD